MRIAILLLFITLTACKTTQKKEVVLKVPEAQKTSEKSDIPKAWQKHPKGKEWTAATLEAMDRLAPQLTLISFEDSEEFCSKDWSKLSRDDRRIFWLNMIAIMSVRESGLKPETKYQESSLDSKGNPIISRGLLQISIESSKSYNCDFKYAEEIHDPIKNLECGIRIINRWTDQDGRIAGKVNGKWRGVARYWNVLRTTSGSYEKVKNYMKELSICSS